MIGWAAKGDLWFMKKNKGAKKKTKGLRNSSKLVFLCFVQLNFCLGFVSSLFLGYFIKPMDPSDRYMAR